MDKREEDKEGISGEWVGNKDDSHEKKKQGMRIQKAKETGEGRIQPELIESLPITSRDPKDIRGCELAFACLQIYSGFPCCQA